MAQTTLAVRLVQMIETTSYLPSFRIVVMTLFVFAASTVPGCSSGGDGEDGGGLSRSAGSAEDGPASASLAWDPVNGVSGYIVHYGTQSPGSPGSCAYAQSAYSSTPTATVSGLAANTAYFFAVSAYNGLESPCSAELSTVTDPV